MMALHLRGDNLAHLHNQVDDTLEPEASAEQSVQAPDQLVFDHSMNDFDCVWGVGCEAQRYRTRTFCDKS